MSRQEDVATILPAIAGALEQKTGEAPAFVLLATQFQEAQSLTISFIAAKDVPPLVALKVLDKMQQAIAAEIRAAKVKLNTVKASLV